MSNQDEPEIIRELYESLSDLMNLLETGKLVRNTDDDFKYSWVTDAMNIVQVIKRAHSALNDARFTELAKPREVANETAKD